MQAMPLRGRTRFKPRTYNGNLSIVGVIGDLKNMATFLKPVFVLQFAAVYFFRHGAYAHAVKECRRHVGYSA